MSDHEERTEDPRKTLVEMFAELKEELKEHVEQVVYTATNPENDEENEDDNNEESGDLQLATQLDRLTNPNSECRDDVTDELKDLTQQFSTSEKTSAPIDEDLAKMIEGLINDKLPKTKLEELIEKYARPENCTNLVAPKTNKAVWSQLRDTTKKLDSGMQKCQKLFLNAAYAIIQASKTTTGETKTEVIHALVLIMCANREMNVNRRENLKPDLNSQYRTLCSVSTPITTELFGDDMGKQIDEVTKANKLAKKIAGPKKTRGSRFQPYGRTTGSSYFSRNRGGGRGFSRPPHFLGDRNTDRRKSDMKTSSHTKVTRD